MNIQIKFFRGQGDFCPKPYLGRYPSVTIFDWLWWRLYIFR